MQGQGIIGGSDEYSENGVGVKRYKTGGIARKALDKPTGGKGVTARGGKRRGRILQIVREDTNSLNREGGQGEKTKHGAMQGECTGHGLQKAERGEKKGKANVSTGFAVKCRKANGFTRKDD